jgi:hypothetical protein
MDHVRSLLEHTECDPDDAAIAAAIDALPDDCCVDCPDVKGRTLMFLASCRAPGRSLPLTLRALRRRNASSADAYLLSSSAQLRELFELFPDIDANKRFGPFNRTALHWLAVVMDDVHTDGLEMIRTLIAHGARLDVLDLNGERPWDIAQSGKRCSVNDKPNDMVCSMLQQTECL